MIKLLMTEYLQCQTTQTFDETCPPLLCCNEIFSFNNDIPFYYVVERSFYKEPQRRIFQQSPTTHPRLS